MLHFLTGQCEVYRICASNTPMHKKCASLGELLLCKNLCQVGVTLWPVFFYSAISDAIKTEGEGRRRVLQCVRICTYMHWLSANVILVPGVKLLNSLQTNL